MTIDSAFRHARKRRRNSGRWNPCGFRKDHFKASNLLVLISTSNVCLEDCACSTLTQSQAKPLLVLAKSTPLSFLSSTLIRLCHALYNSKDFQHETRLLLLPLAYAVVVRGTIYKVHSRLLVHWAAQAARTSAETRVGPPRRNKGPNISLNVAGCNRVFRWSSN